MSCSIKEKFSKKLNMKIYMYEIEFIDPNTKKRIREAKSGFLSKSEAKNFGKRREIELRDSVGLGFNKEKIKFEKYINDWIKTIEPQLANSTWKRYKIAIDKILIPKLGNKYLDKIKASDINNLYLYCINELGNSTTTVRQYHWILSKAFKNALKWKYISYNVMDSIDPPKKAKKELTVYTNTQLFTLLDSLQKFTCFIPVMLASTTGLRLGEICGLRWKDVDLEQKVVSVTRQLQDVNGELELLQLKTTNSNRKVPLLEYTISKLKELKIIQDFNKTQNNNYNKNDFLVCKEDGSPYSPDYISKNYRRVMKEYKICEKLELPYIRFHDLRHTYATMLLSANVNPKVVAELVGHSSVSMTLNVYSHVLPSLKENAISKLENLISSN